MSASNAARSTMCWLNCMAPLVDNTLFRCSCTGWDKIKHPNTKIAISQKCLNIFAPNLACLFGTILYTNAFLCAVFTWRTSNWRKRKLQERISQLNIKLILLMKVKTTFHYSSQLQAWSKSWSQAGRKPAANLLKTVFYLYSIFLARARTSEPAAPAIRDQVIDKKVESWSKACRKPARTCRKPGRKPGLQPGLQLVRIMHCGLNWATSTTFVVTSLFFVYVQHSIVISSLIFQVIIAFRLITLVMGRISYEDKARIETLRKVFGYRTTVAKISGKGLEALLAESNCKQADERGSATERKAR